LIFLERSKILNSIIYITSAPRCGKTTLSNVLMEKIVYKTSIISLDSFSKSIRNVFTDFKLYSKPICIKPDTNNEVFLSLIKTYIENFFADYHDYTLIIEGCHFTPSEFKKNFSSSIVICLGRTMSKENTINAIKEKSWMAELSDEEINKYADLILHYSKELSQNKTEDYLYCETDNINYTEIEQYIEDKKANCHLYENCDTGDRKN